MYDFAKGVQVQYAQAHEVTFTPNDGQLPATLDLKIGSKIEKMTLFQSFLLVETKKGASIAIPVSNFKSIVLPSN